MKVKVLRIIARLNIGGPARNAVLLTKGLADYDTVLVCGEVPGNEGDMMYLAKEKGIEPVIVKELGRELSVKNDWQAFWKIYRVVCRVKPDIIHTHTAKAGTLGRLAGALYNCRGRRRAILVHTFHGHVLRSYFGRVKTLFFIAIEKVWTLFTDKIITVSASLKKELVEKFRIAPEERFSVIELGFELGELLNLPLKDGRDCLNIGIVGRLAPIKNHRMLFRAVNSLKDLKFKVMVIGDGELRQELESYVRELGIEDMVEFKGWIRDLAEIYEKLDIVVLTSVNEGTPVSIIEAMAAARPVVATRVGGVGDIVKDGENGYLVESNDTKAFTDKLLYLINNPDARNRFGKYGRELARERFSKQRLISDMDKLYNKLLGMRRR